MNVHAPHHTRLIFGAALLICGHRLAAQAVITGRITEAGTHIPLAAVQVVIPQLGLATLSDTAGRYWLDSIPAGSHRIVVRRLGFDSVSTVLTLSDADSVPRDFSMLRSAQALEPVTVKGAAAPINAKLREFERRRSSGLGRFVTEDDIAKYHAYRTADIIARFPGAAVARSYCSTAAYVFSSRGVQTISNPSPIRTSCTKGRTACPVAVYLDGAGVYMGGEQPFDVNSIQPTEIAAMEFYAGPAQMPVELNATGYTCGALVIWTK